MIPVRPTNPDENDEQLRQALDRIDRLEHRLRRLERQVAATSPPGWECTRCGRGWVSARGGVLECNRCSFRRHI